MCSHKKSNPFIGYPIEERGLKILYSIYPNGTDEDYEAIINDGLVITAIDIYNEIQDEASPSLKFYNASVKAAETMTKFFIDLDCKLSSRYIFVASFSFLPPFLSK